MRVHIVYAHPSHDCFTGAILNAFVDGLDDAGHTHTISDLYAMGFEPLLSLDEYRRESTYAVELPVPDDVAAEQVKLDAADAWVFIYPVWWTDCPAILKGWFDRVWTAGYAYDPGHTKAGQHTPASQPVAQKALVLCAAGHTEDELRTTGLYQAMEAVMLGDRIGTRAQFKEFVVLGGSADVDPQAWPEQREALLDKARQLGREIATVHPAVVEI